VSSLIWSRSDTMCAKTTAAMIGLLGFANALDGMARLERSRTRTTARPGQRAGGAVRKSCRSVQTVAMRRKRPAWRQPRVCAIGIFNV
jgi:hypothetical protein